MRAPLSDDRSLHERSATGTRFSFAAVYLMPVLKAARPPRRIYIIGYGGASELDSFLKQLPGNRLKSAGAGSSNFACSPGGMQTGAEQCLIGIDIANSSNGVLIQQCSLDSGLSPQEPLMPAATVQSIRTKAIHAGASAFNTAEHANIVVQQNGIFELKHRSGVRREFAIEEKFPCHPKMDRERTGIVLHDEKLAVPGYIPNPMPSKRSRQILGAVPHDSPVQNLNTVHPAASQPGAQLSQNCFYLGQLRHRRR